MTGVGTRRGARTGLVGLLAALVLAVALLVMHGATPSAHAPGHEMSGQTMNGMVMPDVAGEAAVPGQENPDAPSACPAALACCLAVTVAALAVAAVRTLGATSTVTRPGSSPPSRAPAPAPVPAGPPLPFSLCVLRL